MPAGCAYGLPIESPQMYVRRGESCCFVARQAATVSLFLDVQNVTNRLNPEGFDYNDDYTEIAAARDEWAVSSVYSE